MLDTRLHALEQPRRLQVCAQAGLGSGWEQGQTHSNCMRWNVVQVEALQ